MEILLSGIKRIESQWNNLVSESVNISELPYLIKLFEDNLEIMLDYKKIKVKSEETQKIFSQSYDFNKKFSKQLRKKKKKWVGRRRWKRGE